MVATRCSVLYESSWNHSGMWFIRHSSRRSLGSATFRPTETAHRRNIRPILFPLSPCNSAMISGEHHNPHSLWLFQSRRVSRISPISSTVRTMVSVVDRTTTPPEKKDSTNDETILNQSSFHRYLVQQQKASAAALFGTSATTTLEEDGNSALSVSSSSSIDPLQWMELLLNVVQEIQRIPNYQASDSALHMSDQIVASSELLLEATQALPDQLKMFCVTNDENITASTKQSISQIHFAFLNQTTHCINGLRRLLPLRTYALHNESPRFEDSTVSANNEEPIISPSTSFGSCSTRIAVDKLQSMALRLAQRTHAFGLPFHFPLSQSLMEVIALSSLIFPEEVGKSEVFSIASGPGDVHSVIHQVVTLTVSGTYPPVGDCSPNPSDDASALTRMIWRPSSALFRPALVALLREEAFLESLELLRYLRDQYGLVVLDLITTSSIYETIYEKVSHALRLRLRCLFRTSDEPITEIVAMLEPSVIVFQAEWKQERRQQEETYNQLLDALDSDSFERLADSLSQYDVKIVSDLDEFDVGDDDSVDTDASTYGSYDDDDSEDDRDNHRSIDRSVHRMITRRVKNELAKQIMESFVPYSLSKKDRSFSASNFPKIVTVPVQPQLAPNTAVEFDIHYIELLPKPGKVEDSPSVTSISESPLSASPDRGSSDINLPIESTEANAPKENVLVDTLDDNKMPTDMSQNIVDTAVADSEQTQEVEEADDFDDEIEDWTDEADNRFPDITQQVVELNPARYLAFTRRYADILWLRESMDEEGEEDEEDEEKSGDSRRRDGRLDSDDDDDEFEYETDSDNDSDDDDNPR